jgi:hypothetical protein
VDLCFIQNLHSCGVRSPALWQAAPQRLLCSQGTCSSVQQVYLFACGPAAGLASVQNKLTLW